MAKVGVLWRPDAAEQAVLNQHLDWIELAGPSSDVEVALSFFPRREMKQSGLAWADLPNLRLIQSCTAGLNHMGWTELPPVSVAAAPGATGSFIAEYVLACTLAWSRGLLRHTRLIGKGDFKLGDPVRALSELQIGIVGMGGIGCATADLLAGLGCTVRGVSRTGQPVRPAPFANTGTMDALSQLMAVSDVVVVCLPLTRETEGLVDLDRLSGMAGRSCLLINVARGPIVKEDALFAWLDSSSRHWAALDVWWQYPSEGKPYSYPFESLPNVIMTPHNSPNVTGFRVAMLEQACRQVKHFLATGEAQHVHDPALYRTREPGDER